MKTSPTQHVVGIDLGNAKHAVCGTLRSTGEIVYERSITNDRKGDAYFRRLLVSCAQYILGPFGPDCDLRTRGLALAARGGKRAKKKAVIATARKLAVVMLSLVKSGENYESNRNSAA